MRTQARWSLPAALLACVLSLTVATRAEALPHQKHLGRSSAALTAVSADTGGSASRLDLHITGSAAPPTIRAFLVGYASAGIGSSLTTRTVAATPARAPPVAMSA